MKYNILRFEENFIPQVLDVLKCTFKGVSKNDYFSEKYFRWKHINNPHGESVMYVALDKNNKIVAFRAFMRWKIKVNGITYEAFRPVDSAVSPLEQGGGLFKTLTFKAMGSKEVKNGDFIFNTPNNNSLPIYTKQSWGWKEHSKVRFSIYPINIFNFTSIFKINRRESNYLDKAVLDLYSHSLFQNSSIVDKEYLTWRYLDNPIFRYEYVNVSSDHVAVYRRNKRYVLDEIILVDVLSKKDPDNMQVELKIKDFKRLVGGDYLLVNRDVLRNVKIKDGFSVSPSSPYFNLVFREGKSTVDFDDIIFPIRDLELF